MEILVGIVLVLFIILIVKITRKEKDISLRELVKKTFPEYIIIEKNKNVMICEINHRNEPDELAFLRLNTNRPKTVKKEGRRLKVEYQKIPTSTELKRDLKQVIK